MSNQIDSVKKINEELSSSIKRLEAINEQLLQISKSASNLGSLLGGVKTPKGLGDELGKQKDNLTLFNALIKEREATERKLTSTIAKQILIQDDATKNLAKENEEYKILRQEQRNQVKAVSDLAGAYTNLSSKTNILIKRYQDLAVRQAKGEQLTERETRRLEKLGQVIEKNQNILKKTDAEVGRFQRNVGNYAGSFNGLNVAVAQIAREAPAAAVSLNTFILGISNNIPQLQDELTKLIAKNKELISQGKPTVSVFKSLASALLSPQVLLSALVTVLTLYNKQIFEFIQKTIQGGEKVRDLAQQQKILNEAYKEGAKSASQEIAQLQLLLAVASDKTKSDKTRKLAVDKLIKSSGGLVKEQERLNILNGEAVEIENRLVKAILNKAIVQQLRNKISEDINKLLDNQIKIQREQEIVATKLNKQEFLAFSFGEKRKELLEALTDEERKRVEVAKELQKQGQKIVLSNREVENTEKSVNKVKKDNEVIQSNIINLIKQALKLTDDYTLSLDNNTKSIKTRNRAIATDLKTVEEQVKAQSKLSKIFEGLFKNFNTKALKDAQDDLNIFDPRTIKRYFDAIENNKAFNKVKDDIIDVSDRLEEFNKAVSDDLIKAFDKELLNESLNELSDTLQKFTGVNGEKFKNFFEKITQEGAKSFEDIADIANASFGAIGETINAFYSSKIAQYDADIQANEEYYQNLLDNENLTDEEKKRLEQDREGREEEIRERQRREQRKQAEINRAIAVAEIITNTAKAVVSALPNIPLSVAVGAIGAVQLGIALATPIPQFAEGGVMGHDGLMMINDHKSGRLEVVERDGKLLMTDKKNAIVEGKRGDIIHKDAKEYFSNLSDEELLKNINQHTMLATLQHQNYLISKFENKKVIDASKLNADRIIKAINSKKTRFNLNQNINIAEDLNFLSRGNNLL